MLLNLMQVLGGLGLFLLGMVVMTDGLKGLAGDALNHWLARFTKSPATGAMTGTVTTALLQSSSATTVAAVGFVGAGLLTFPQALGVIFGANLGTTVTGWLVALLGLKLQIGTLVFPLIFIGALLRLFARGRWRHLGFALAGFALLFQGISVLQAAMAGYHGAVIPADFPSDTLLGRLQLIAIGIAITLITQSSSAGVATALTAVNTGTISFGQAAALVIGMDVGTTVTAAVATLGGSADTRRTGYSHVTYNLLTAIGALLLLDGYTWAWQQWLPGALQHNAEIALVGFHSLFNLLGVIVVLPLARPFARLMFYLVPAPSDPVLDRLDHQLLKSPDVALDNVVQIVERATQDLVTTVDRLLTSNEVNNERLLHLDRQLDATHAFVDQIHLVDDKSPEWSRLNAVIHVLDHLQRLVERCIEEPERARSLVADVELGRQAARVSDVLQRINIALAAGDDNAAEQIASANAAYMRKHADRLRNAVMAEVAAGSIDVPTGTRRLEGIRWLRRVAYHVWRVSVHLPVLRRQ